MIECGIGVDGDTIDDTPYLGVYHHHEWDHGYEAIYGFNGSRREFYADVRDMMSFLLEYFSINGISEVVIAPFFRYYQFDERYFNSREVMPGLDIFDEIREFLRKHGIRKGERSGVKIQVCQNIDVIEMIVEGLCKHKQHSKSGKRYEIK